MLWQFVSNVIGNPFAMFWQSVSSRRGPIYRTRIYEYIHEMGNENSCAVKRMCIFNNVKMRVRWNGYVYLIMLGYGRDESAPTPNGMFATHFTVCFVALLAIRSQL